MLDKLKSGGVQVEAAEVTVSAEQPLSGKTFVITGALSKPRSHFKGLIESRGGKVAGSVSSKTNYLVAGEKAGSKLARAEKLGVKILDEERLAVLLEQA